MQDCFEREIGRSYLAQNVIDVSRREEFMESYPRDYYLIRDSVTAFRLVATVLNEASR